ncbi:IS4 family transposase [Planctomycetota bacterium]
MRIFGRTATFLEGPTHSFSVEALAKILPPEWVLEALAESGKKSTRVRRWPTALVVWFLILLGIFRRASYENLLEKLHGSWWTRQLWSLKKPPGTSGVTKARDRVGVEPLRRLFYRSSGVWANGTCGDIVAGRRAVALDGICFKVFDSEANREYFGTPGCSRGNTAFPQVRTVQLSDVANRFVVDFEHGPWETSELELAERLRPRIPVGSLVLMDRNFYSFAFLWALHSEGLLDFLVRAKTGKTALKPRLIKVLDVGDEIVELRPPKSLKRALPRLPDKWRLRRIRYRVNGGETTEILTTILDPQLLSKDDAVELYHDRWQIETSADEVKTHFCDCATVNRPVAFRGKTPERVQQELYATFTAYNAARKLIAEAAPAANVDPHRISFIAAVERVREGVQAMQTLPTAALRCRYRQMLDATARVLVPFRPGRSVRRGVRVKMSKFPLKYPQEKEVAA